MPIFEREVEINAPVEKVWAVMIDPNRWPEWFPGVQSVSNVSSTGQGGTFDWTDAGKTGHGTIVSMEPMKHLEIMTQMGNDKDSHVFHLQPGGGFLGLNAGECKVQYSLDTLMGGGILANFIAGGNPGDVLRVKNSLDQFKRLIETK